MKFLVGALIVGQTGLVRWREEVKVSRRVGHADVEEAHLVAGGAVAFVEADGGDLVCSVTESGGREGYEYDVAHVATVAGAVIRAACWWGRGGVRGCC